MGRAIRTDASNPEKKAFILENEDKLPYIRYLIDNRMLWMDIDDALEPNIEDFRYEDEASYKDSMSRVFEQFNVPEEFKREVPIFESKQQYAVLLFKFYSESGSDQPHFPLFLTRENKRQVVRFYNFLSAKIEKWRDTVKDHREMIKTASQ